jgi:hypothetical protein
MTRYLGGLITKDESLVIPANNFENTSAPGVWTLEEAQMLAKQGLWPTAGNAYSPGFVLAGGGSYKTIHQFNMASQADSTDFGDASDSNIQLASAFGSSTRMVAHLGLSNTSTIEYWTVATGGDGTDFGDITVQRYGGAGTSSSTRGLISGGYSNVVSNIIDYVTIASAGNATDFGDLVDTFYRTTGGQSTTRSYTATGYKNNPLFANNDDINYVTIASTGNATDFGSATAAKRQCFSGQSNSTRGIIAGGYSSSQLDVIEYITIASTGNGTDFGDLQAADSSAGGACTSSTRWFGFDFGGSLADIQYITIASTGNSQDWADLTTNDLSNSTSGASASHGGIS